MWVALAAAVLPAYAAEEDCVACRYFESIRIGDGSTVFDSVLLRLKTLPPASVTLQGGAFCSTRPGSSVAETLTGAANEQYARASEIADKAKQCPQACAPALSDADYCAYGDRLFTDRYRLGAVATRLTDLAQLYERAGKDEKPPLQVLSSDMTLYGGEAMNVVKEALQALAAGDAAAIPDVCWQASSTELTGLFGSVALMADFSLIGGDVAQLETALD